MRLCEAAALSQTDGHGRELITGLFARKVLHVLNEACHDRESSVDITAASPSEISTLLWALGELGAKHSLEFEGKHSAHKKMRLVVSDVVLTEGQLRSLDASSALKLVRTNFDA